MIDLSVNRRKRDEPDRRMACDDRCRRRRRPAEGDIDEVEIESQPELFARQVRLRTNPSVREAESAGVRSDLFDQLLNGVRRDGWIDNEHRRRCDCKRNRCKVFLRIDPGLRKKARTDHERPEHKQDRVAVRRRLCRVGGSDIARGTCDVLDIELLTEVLAEPWRDLPRQDVHAAPRRKRHDDAHGSRRVSQLCT